jgi:hypothetical protein
MFEPERERYILKEFINILFTNLGVNGRWALTEWYRIWLRSAWLKSVSNVDPEYRQEQADCFITQCNLEKQNSSSRYLSAI